MRVLPIAGLVLLGAVAGISGAFVHGATARLGGVPLPYGLVVALLGVAAGLTVAHLTVGGRLARAAVAVGWLLPVFALSQARSSGDLVVAGNAAGLAFALGGVVFSGLAVGLPTSRTVRATIARDLR